MKLREIEKIKAQLISDKSFSYMDAFSIFDPHGYGWCTDEEFHRGLSYFQPEIIPQLFHVQLLFQRFNKSKDGRFKFNEFVKALIPKNKYYQSLVK